MTMRGLICLARLGHDRPKIMRVKSNQWELPNDLDFAICPRCAHVLSVWMIPWHGPGKLRVKPREWRRYFPKGTW